MKRSEDRILTTHVGSLIRPPELLAFAMAKQQGQPYDEQAYEACLRRAVADVVRKQAEVGIDIVNDGEFGKSSWANYILERLSGFEVRRDQPVPLVWLGRDRERFADFFAAEMPGAVTGGAAEVSDHLHGSAQHPAGRGQSQGGARRGERRGSLPHGGGAGQHRLQRHQRVLPERAGVRLCDR
jgi:hypothetical protein